MAGPIPITSPLLLLCISAILVLLGLALPPSAANNVLLSGETLAAVGRLANGDHNLVMGRDGNLALDDGAWQSGTTGRGSGCRLMLEGDGRLVVTSEDGSTVWTSLPESSQKGEYVAVVDPRGRVSVYGPAVRSAAGLGGQPLRQRLGCLNSTGSWDNCIIPGDDDLLNSPLLPLPHRVGRSHRHQRLSCLHGGNRDNCIIDGSTAAADNVLFSGVRRFGLRGGCGGGRCILRLDNRGGLAVVDGDDHVIWSNDVRSAEGKYVAVLRRDGEVAVYGPVIWSTAGWAAGGHLRRVTTNVNRKIGDVEMLRDHRE